MRIEYPSAEMTKQLRGLWHMAFGDSEAFMDCFFEKAFAPERCRCVTLDGTAAAALYWFDVAYSGQKLAYLYAVATHPQYRNRGLCRKLMEDTHALLAEKGYAGAVLYPAEDGLRRMYATMGYRSWGGIGEFACAAGEAVPVRRIGAAEYARLRRQLLPPGGVIQEGENLRYLESYAKLYAGEDFLLAAVREGKNLLGLELLGNKQAAPGILGALGCVEGTFRTPGEDRPFAMFHPLNADAQPPGYFGLVFD